MAEKPLPWFRAYPEAAFDPKFEIIARQLEIENLFVFGAWWKILCIAGNSPIRGSLYVTFQKRFSNGDVAALLGISDDLCNTLLEAFKDLDMIYQDENGAWRITNWEKRQFDSDNSTERVKKFREKAKTNECNGDETLHDRFRNGDETPPDTDTDPDTEYSGGGGLRENSPEIFATYEKEIGPITPFIADELKAAEKEFPKEWIISAFQESARQNARSMKYVLAILRRWQVDGFQSVNKPTSNGNVRSKYHKPTKAEELAAAAKELYGDTR